MIALGDAPGDLKIDRLIVERRTRNQLADDRFPFGGGVRIGEPDAVEAALQACEVLREAIRLAVIDGNQFIGISSYTPSP